VSRFQEPYLHPEELELKLSRVIGHAGKEYIVLVGPKGVGKSTLVNHAVLGETGIVGISLSSDKENIYSGVLKKLCGFENAKIDLNIENVDYILSSVIKHERLKENILSDWVPTLLIEIDRASTSAAIHQIARDMKLLCVDRMVCRGIIVLSDALAAFALPYDPRVKLLWIDDFTVEEAHRFYDLLNFLPVQQQCANIENNNNKYDENNNSSLTKTTFNINLRTLIFEKIGTRPIDLIRIYDDSKFDVNNTITENIESRIKECKVVLKGLFVAGDSVNMNFEMLVKEILNSPTKSIEVESLQKSPLQIVKNVAIVLKDHHALLYHFPTQTFRFYSKCMEQAAIVWQESLKKNNNT
jgi:energy-coupling factor transporter ATP-binding protein EcfA2